MSILNKINFLYHINDLKYHLILYIYIIFQIILISYYYNLEITYILVKPLINLINLNYFIFTNITELFLIKIIISFYFGFIISLLFLLFQIWIFLSKGLFKNENIQFLYYFCLFLFIFILSNKIILNFIIPISWNFFITNEEQSFLYTIQLEPRIYKYLLFTIKLIILINFIFQVPFFIILCISLKLFSINLFFKFRKFIYLVIFLISTLISPPDFFSQYIISVIIILILEVLIFFKFFYK